MALAVEIALAVARRDISAVQIKDKLELYRALTDGETLDRLLEQTLEYTLSDNDVSHDAPRVRELCRKDNRDKIVDYFTTIKDKVKLEELKFYE